jgi:hypothetical protein
VSRKAVKEDVLKFERGSILCTNRAGECLCTNPGQIRTCAVPSLGKANVYCIFPGEEGSRETQSGDYLVRDICTNNSEPELPQYNQELR